MRAGRLASYGADKQHEAASFSLTLLGAPENLKAIAAVHPACGILACRPNS